MKAYLKRIEELYEAIVENDQDLGEHCARVAVLAGKVASLLEVENKEAVYCAALVHDIGKLFVNPEILQKPSSLSQDERALVDLHSVMGFVFLHAMHIPQEVSEMVLLHHGYKKERYGFNEIPDKSIGADIIRTCDIYDAVTHDRPYHKGMPPMEAFGILHNQPEPLPDEAILALEDVCGWHMGHAAAWNDLALQGKKNKRSCKNSAIPLPFPGKVYRDIHDGKGKRVLVPQKRLRDLKSIQNA